MKPEDMELKYNDGTIALWKHKKFPGWDLTVRPAATVLPVTPDGKLIVMRERKENPDHTVTGFPGGMIEDGETSAEAAVREAAEELGISVGRTELITTVHTDFPDTDVSYFLGFDLGKADRKDWEIIESVEEMTMDQVYRMALDGELTDPRLVVAALALKRKLDRHEVSLDQH